MRMALEPFSLGVAALTVRSPALPVIRQSGRYATVRTALDYALMQNSQLGRRDFLVGLTGAAAAAAAAARSVSAASVPAWMYVGRFTGEGRGHGEGLSVFRRANESDRWQRVQLLKDLADPSFVIIDRRRGCLYSAHGDGTQATAYKIDQANGRVSVLNQQPTGGRNGVHLAIDATGRFLVLANYATGTVAL